MVHQLPNGRSLSRANGGCTQSNLTTRRAGRSRAMTMPTQIDPIYRTESANSPVELGAHQVILIHDGLSEPLRDANFSLRLLSYPRLVISMQLLSHVRIDEVATVEIPASYVRFPTVSPMYTQSTQKRTSLCILIEIISRSARETHQA